MKKHATLQSRLHSRGKEPEPSGLIMVQIDGLSRPQLEKALAEGRLPFVRSLLQKQGFVLHSLYTGLPSSTPSVQGELFYGIRCCVPAFSFYDKQRGKIFRMYDPDDACEVENRLRRKGPGLLEGGSSYGNIFTGGAAEAVFCIANAHYDRLLKKCLSELARSFPHYAVSITAAAGLLAVEVVLAVIDCIRGVIAGRSLVKELKFIAARAFICIGLREVSTILGSNDIRNGLPVVHINFLGYDEQSHRRNPSSGFAHWSLKGIDRSIRKLFRAARKSASGEYELWLYSDHGQEDTEPYSQKFKLPFRRAVERACGATVCIDYPCGEEDDRGVQARRTGAFSRARHARLQAEKGSVVSPRNRLTLAAMGPLGHVYFPENPADSALQESAQRLVHREGVPMVAARAGPGRISVWTKRGRFTLPDAARDVLGSAHPFAREAARDMVALCNHENAGDLIVCGWSLEERAISFPQENGSHAGPGPEETHAFALLPPGAPAAKQNGAFIRPEDLRRAALSVLQGLASLPPGDAGLT